MTSKPSQIPQEKQVDDPTEAGFDRLKPFRTTRLWVSSWRDTLEDQSARRELEADLATMLSAPVLRHLPERVQLDDGPDAIKTWIADRDTSAAIFMIQDAAGLVGLMFLFRPPDAPKTEPLHLGYLFGETSWGKGYASEMVVGLVEALTDGPVMTLQGGVDVNNPASARVLEKAGFVRDDALCSDEIDIFSRQVGSAQ